MRLPRGDARDAHGANGRHPPRVQVHQGQHAQLRGEPTQHRLHQARRIGAQATPRPRERRRRDVLQLAAIPEEAHHEPRSGSRRLADRDRHRHSDPDARGRPDADADAGVRSRAAA